MKEITKTYEAYEFDELSEEAKNNVREHYFEMMIDVKNDDYYNWVTTYLNEEFPNSVLNVQYSLSHSQGDGLNIFGDLSCIDLLDRLKRSDYLNLKFSEKEIKFLEHVINEFGSDIKLPENYRYCYSLIDSVDFVEDYIWQMEYNDYKNIRYDTLEKFNNYCSDLMNNITSRLEEWGYDYLYEINDDEIIEYCTDCEIYFDVNGNAI